jgi:hypothetical protein
VQVLCGLLLFQDARLRQYPVAQVVLLLLLVWTCLEKGWLNGVWHRYLPLFRKKFLWIPSLFI